MNTKSRQYAVSLLLLLAAALGSTLGYQWVHPERVLFRKAEASFHAGDFRKAEAHYRSALRVLPRSPSARLKLAEVLSRTKQYGEAVALYRAILLEDPANRSARIALARVLTRAGRFEEAVTEYRKALGESK